MKTILTTAALAATVALAGPVQAGDGGVKVGMLSCSLEGKTNVVVYSKAEYDCTLKSSSNELTDQNYTGVIQNFGADLQWNKDEELVWAVIAATSNINNDSLRGDYVGVGASASAGVGVGAKVLVGGFDKAFSLQPVSLSGSVGAGATAGVESFKLR